ncbi:MAG: hypothetical protein A3G24_21015 [Betaproteobacteria bacterium RIFCSPLOWO2_12_FULL_62_13]|nr:MAG: hypothetical protein A3G24_21015 [Betaproteobacteria bacterium RIFCSPLOWO2_12_FULL_62_13]
MSISKWCRPVSAVLILGMGTAAQAASPNMKEGLWEVTAKVQAPDRLASTPPTTVRHCISHKDLQDPQKMTSSTDPRGNRCKVTDHKLEANKVTWKMGCDGKNAMTGSGSITFSETTYTGTSTMSVKQENRTVDMTIRYTGKYIGACTK